MKLIMSSDRRIVFCRPVEGPGVWIRLLRVIGYGVVILVNYPLHTLSNGGVEWFSIVWYALNGNCIYCVSKTSANNIAVLPKQAITKYLLTVLKCETQSNFGISANLPNANATSPHPNKRDRPPLSKVETRVPSAHVPCFGRVPGTEITRALA